MTKSKAAIDSVVSAEVKPRRIKTSFGIEWRVNGKPHRTDGPAKLFHNGNTEWYINGKLHRIGGPAREWSDGGPQWFVHVKQWWVNGRLHRLDGPAEVGLSYQKWWVDGKLHRLNGPAVVRVDGPPHWFVNGREFTEDEFYMYVDQETGEVLVPPGKKLTHDKK